MNSVNPKIHHFSILQLLSVMIVLLTGCDAGFLKSAEAVRAAARQSIDTKNFTEAASIAQTLTEKAPTDYEGYFLLAQAKAQVGDKNAAMVALEQAIKKGLKDDEQIDKNVNLEPIKSMTSFKDLMDASFPGRHAIKEITVSTPNSAVVSGTMSATGVSIHQVAGKQVVRAGDVMIEIPSSK